MDPTHSKAAPHDTKNHTPHTWNDTGRRPREEVGGTQLLGKNELRGVIFDLLFGLQRPKTKQKKLLI